VPIVLEGQFATIVADPPWRDGNTSTRGAAEDHYHTMSIEELCELDVARERAADQAHLYLWTTAGHLPDAFRVMEAWDFTYKTYLVWIKPQMGMGNYFRVSTELVLFGIKGGMRTRDMATMNYFEARRGKHSAKPQKFYELAERCSPGPYLEMFCRCNRATQLACMCSRCLRGWEVWGNQA
jgi:N6-adenosine-specific RNA methylase IME4